MTSHQFMDLDLNSKADIVWKDGTFMNEVIDYGKHRICVYSMYGYFVSVFYNVTTNSIERIEALSDDRMKDKLFSGINFN